MANISEDIQCAGSIPDHLCLIGLTLHHGNNMGTFRDTITDENERAMHLGPERPRVYLDLSPEDKDRYNVDIRATNILLQGLPKDIYTLINHYTNAKDIWDNVKMLLGRLNSKFVNNMLPEWGRFVTAVKLNRGAAGNGGVQNRGGNANPAQENDEVLDEEQLLFLTGGQDTVVDNDVDEPPVQDLALNVENIFQAD
ncbi:hypothetical protein Tco_1073068 [Tanacetum coccineum]